ncbi:MAG: hypothetical protein M3R44_05240 [Candidatus Eremiobacteraeota bacterium]|nr:hypothetical protein [Candidatus Eremiobacteraeota bacterium]
MLRSLALLVLLIVPLCGCKEPQAGAAAATASAGLVRSGTDIAIENVRTAATADNVGFSNDEFYIVTFTFKNDLGYALIPRIDHFVLEDVQGRRFLGADSGNPALIGITNRSALLKPGDTQKYTIGFRVPRNTTGTLYYDATL